MTSFPYKRLISEINKRLYSLQNGISKLENNWVENKHPSLHAQVTSILKKELELLPRDLGYIQQRIERITESLKSAREKKENER